MERLEFSIAGPGVHQLKRNIYYLDINTRQIANNLLNLLPSFEYKLKFVKVKMSVRASVEVIFG